jgi:ABC-type Zn uptake system ZnuABC Zn-binding protein ZnuA
MHHVDCRDDSHGYQCWRCAAADLIILNGLDLETPTEKLALANKKPTARLVKLGDQTITAPPAPGPRISDRHPSMSLTPYVST